MSTIKLSDFINSSLLAGDFATKTTDNLSEGSSNLYFTTARARNSISVTGNLTYNASTGVLGVDVPGTNLAMGGSGDSRTITSSTGNNVSVPVATTTNAGFMATGDKTKLNGIAAGAQVNVGTNLGSSGTGGTRTITSSTGNNTSITYTAADVGAVPTGRTLTAGDGLSGGGTLNANRTLNVDSTVVRTTNNLSDLADAAAARGNIGADNATNLTAGTIPRARIPAGVSTAFGGVKIRRSGSTLFIRTDGANA